MLCGDDVMMGPKPGWNECEAAYSAVNFHPSSRNFYYSIDLFADSMLVSWNRCKVWTNFGRSNNCWIFMRMQTLTFNIWLIRYVLFMLKLSCLFICLVYFIQYQDECFETNAFGGATDECDPLAETDNNALRSDSAFDAVRYNLLSKRNLFEIFILNTLANF